MKRTRLTSIIYISTSIFFMGCSGHTAKPKREVKLDGISSKPTVYNIMGIVEPEKKHRPLFVVKDSPKKVNYNVPIVAPVEPPIVRNKYIEESPSLTPTTDIVSSDIEIISYGSPTTPVETVKTDTESIIDNIEWNAKSFLGTRYVWGATGPTKFDCSGFTQWVYRDVGINIPRVSRDQAKVGNYVRYEDLKRGDMVFFDTKKKRSGKVTHVGIYLGNGDFIHASSSAKKVVVYNFNKKKFYKERFLWGRRVVPEDVHYASNPRKNYY